ncbi:MAG TPA: alpha/beta hydrolase [Candidatus Eremiobacteraceae bacterium]|nr:alpha/beta hydrolase [Candidatus Eremiobacteraceae bacterium]
MATLLCVAIIVPPANRVMLIATVAAVELTPYILILSAIGLFAALRFGGRLRTPVASLAAINILFCAIPIVATVRSGIPLRLPVIPRASDIVEFSVPVDLGVERTSIRAYLPRSGQNNPVVFAIYGGAWQWGSPDNDATLNRYLAARGYAVFALDYRHAPAYEFPTPLGDVRAEIALVTSQAKKYRIDTRRMAILGHSSGGQMAELSAFAPGTPFRALVSFSGAVDLTMGYEFPPSPDPIGVPEIISSYMGGTPVQMPGRYHAASPIDNVRCGSPPTLLIYGNRDHVVDFRSALRLRDALRSCGTDVTLLELPWTEHGFEDVPWGLHASIAFAEVETFLHRTLQ